MPTRKPLRLRRYDYSAAGAYFVTTCVAGKECVLGRVVGVSVVLSALGRIVAGQLARLQETFAVEIDCQVVMPNHVHVVLVLHQAELGLGTVVGSFKAGSAREINALRGRAGEPFWQRGFFDHVVRNDADLDRVREYIATNPLRWSLSREESVWSV